MRLLVSLLLIPVFVLGQMLPHSHAGSGVAEPDGHSIRPHIHLRGHHHDAEVQGDDEHHGHRHDGGEHCESEHASENSPIGLSEPTEHDSDAVYLPESDWSASRSLANDVELPSVPQARGGGANFFATRPIIRVAAHPPDRDSKLPVYLFTASLRL